MRDKIRAKQDHQYGQDYLLVAGLVYHWRKLRPENDELKAMALAMADINKYVSGLQADLRVLEDLLNEQGDE